MPTTTNFKNDTDKEIETMLQLLREVYDLVEMSHLNDNKLIPMYCTGFRMKRSLCERIFGYLQSKDQMFRDTVIKRQNRFIRKRKL